MCVTGFPSWDQGTSMQGFQGVVEMSLFKGKYSDRMQPAPAGGINKTFWHLGQK